MFTRASPLYIRGVTLYCRYVIRFYFSHANTYRERLILNDSTLIHRIKVWVIDSRRWFISFTELYFLFRVVCLRRIGLSGSDLNNLFIREIGVRVLNIWTSIHVCPSLSRGGRSISCETLVKLRGFVHLLSRNWWVINWKSLFRFIESVLWGISLNFKWRFRFLKS